MKILIVQKDSIINGMGGAEKVLIEMANQMHSKGYEVVVATNENKDGKPFYKLDESISFKNIYSKKHCLVCKKEVSSCFICKIISKLPLFKKKFFFEKLEKGSQKWQKFIEEEKPDVVIAFSIYTMLEMTYSWEPKTPFIVTVHGRPDYDFSDVLWTKDKFEADAIKNIYKKVTTAQVLVNGYLDYLPDEFKGNKVVISNTAPVLEKSQLANIKQEKNIVINIARLDTHHKCQDFLIKAFNQVSPIFPNWQLHIYGDGKDKIKLEKLVKKLKLEDKVFLKGVTKNALEKLKTADVFAFPSAYEGWPLALAEAMAVGLPCIGLNSCSGLNEVIQNEETGFLTENNIDDFSVKLKELMDSKEIRVSMGKKSKEYISEFTPQNIWNKWDKVIKETVENYEQN